MVSPDRLPGSSISLVREPVHCRRTPPTPERVSLCRVCVRRLIPCKGDLASDDRVRHSGW